MSRPSDGMTLEDLREEYDWMYEFQSRMAEHISGDPDVHNLVDYVNKLAAENDKLRDLVRNLYACINHRYCDYCEYADEACEFERDMRELGVEVDE